jgi:predicted esterase
MNISSGFISTKKTARYFILGELTDNTPEIWIVLHGYAQLASDFIKPFEAIATPERVIVAPEGLNRFYAKGFGGKAVATWMTSESREDEIRDYIAYLNTLCISLNLQNRSSKIVLLGFSQGVATATRWLNQTTLPISKLIIYAGDIASELQNPISPKLLTIPIVYITGTHDNLISIDKLSSFKLLMKTLNATMIEFDGGHEVKPEVLKTWFT